MNADQFQDLYMLLRGNREAIAVLDAKALFMEKKLLQAYEKVSEARETFAESHNRVLRQTPEQQLDPKARDADRQLKKLQRKHDKAQEVIKTFDEILPQLKKQVERAQRHMELEATREEASDAAHRETQEIETQETVTQEAENQETGPREAIARSGDLGEALIEALRGAAQAQQLDIINQHFGFREVQSDQDIHGDALYYVHTKQTSILACTPSADQMKDSVELISLVDNRPINPFSRAAFLRLGTKRKMVLLTLRENRDTEQQERERQETGAEQLDVSTSRETEATDEVDQEQGVSTQRSVDETDESGEEPEQNILDLGAFSQLLTSAQRSGLVPEADQIGYVRDREFRMGKYDLAFQTVDAMFSRFMASAGQRTQSLAREDAEIASGRIKISPKDLLAKRARERSQTQEIERAKRRFQVVLEGLRALMNAGS